MRPIGIDDLSLRVECAQAKPGEVLVIDYAYNKRNGQSSPDRNYCWPDHVAVHGVAQGDHLRIFGAFIATMPDREFACYCGDDQCVPPPSNKAEQEYWTMRIAVWPDGDWCNLEIVEAFMREQGLSDDYSTYTAASDDEAERVAARVAAGSSR